MKKIMLTVFIVSLSMTVMSAVSHKDTTFIETPIALQTSSGTIHGTLTLPGDLTSMPVALIIAGSGPTDRDGNGFGTKSDCLKQLAHELGSRQIASVRFDKRGIAESKTAAGSEADLRFDSYVNDAAAWIKLLKQDKRFSKVVVIGHSEGSLIGMIAANQGADSYVSIAGAGRSADKILKEQLSSQPDDIKTPSYRMIDSLMLGKTVTNVDARLNMLFRPSVQPYLISWFQYDPAKELQKLKIPVLIIQGTNDLQVSLTDAQALKTAKPDAKLALIENMNHIFRIVQGDRQANVASYNDPLSSVSQELVGDITSFIRGQTR